MKTNLQKWGILLTLMLGNLHTLRAQQISYVQQKTGDGILEGVVSADDKVRTFKGIPYAAPPVGPLRWRAPQPVAPWAGVRKAADYGPRAMQGRIYDDMIFNDAGPSEDCLYLNLWMPAHPAAPRLPVMVWIHGGGFIAGSSSEPRQDAGNLSKKDVLVVSMNYRMGIFGFFSHPGLASESGHEASGNYGLMDQVAALQWVKNNIAVFGGDPDNVTIFGESAGSFSVSALMASPLARGLFQRAIGESGALFSATEPLESRTQAEEACVKFAESAFGNSSLEALRAKPAGELLDAALKLPQNAFRPIIDGYFLPSDVLSIFAAGKQSHVPLLAGWNRDEGNFKSYFGSDAPTLENFAALAKAKFGSREEAFLKAYAATNDAQAKRAAQDFAGDQFIAYATWKWMEMQLKTGQSPVYRYQFDQTLPLPANARGGAEPTAPHASEIEYVFRVLTSRRLPWRQEDRDVSELMASYWCNFAKTGDPNGPGLPAWPAYNSGSGYPVMHLKADSAASPDDHRGRYEFLDHAAQNWVSLFDGKSLDGWQPSEVKTTWKVVDGSLVSGGGRSHLFYMGDVNKHDFKNFELKADVKTSNGANSGIYIHTHYQETGFPDTGYECQVINSYPPGSYVERKMTGSIYAIRNVWKAPVPDNQWFHYHIIVQGKTIQTYINDELMAEYTESASPFRPGDKKGRLLSSGTFALQGHDAKSVVAIRNIEVKVLPDDLPTPGQALDDAAFEARIIQFSDDNFPLLDLNVQLGNGLTQDKALANARKYGFTCGLVFNYPIPAGYLPPLQAFTGIRLSGPDQWNLLASHPAGSPGANYDYVLAVPTTSGAMRDARPADPQQFMESLVAQIEKLAAAKGVNIYAEATALPDSLKADYDTLWTDARRDRVIKALHDGGVAMEINDRLQVPSAAFIKRAKAAGVKFTFGSGNTGPADLGRLSYCIAMISECQLRPANLWFPF